LIHAEKATTTRGNGVLAGSGRISVARMCQLLGVSRAGYYAWAARSGGPPSPRVRRRSELWVKIARFHAASDQTYGAPRITADLREDGEKVSVKTVAKIMRAHHIAGISPRRFTPVTTISDTSAHTIPDRVGRRFDQGALNRVWTSDITYLATGQGWLYLCAVRDGHSRRVIGYAFAETLHTDIVETALRRAVHFRAGDTSSVIFHADRGCQYTSDQLAYAAARLGVLISVGRTGVCWDNAQIESYWSTLKTEYYDRHTFTTHAQAIQGVTNWIENVYNRRRRHSALGYQTPVAFEHHTTAAAHQAA